MPPVCLTAQKGHYNLKFQLSKKNFADTIGIELQEGRVLVPVTIDGCQRRFMLDTGAAQAIIYDDSHIGSCQPAGTIGSFDAVGHREEVPLVTLPPLTIGTLTLTGCQATVHQRPRTARQDFDGIIGFDLVCKGISMKIDTEARLLILTDRKKLFDSDGRGFEAKYKVRPYFHTPYLEAEPFTGYKEEVLFDTGSRRLYVMGKESFGQSLPACQKQRAGQVEGRAQGSYMMGLHGRERKGEVVFLSVDRLTTFGGFSFCELHTQTTSGGSHLGAGVLKYGSVTFLPQRKTVRFLPYDGQSRVAIGNRQTEKAIGNRNGLPVAEFVWRDGKAFAAGLREGDTILKADGHAFASFDDYARFRYLIGHVYTFIVRDLRGIQKEVRMEW